MATRAPAIIALSTSRPEWTPPVTARSALNLPVQDGDPVQPQQQFVRRTQAQVRPDLQRGQVEVRLVEAVEQHQRVGPRLGQPPGEGGRGAEERPDFHGQRQNWTLSRTARTIST